MHSYLNIPGLKGIFCQKFLPILCHSTPWCVNIEAYYIDNIKNKGQFSQKQ